MDEAIGVICHIYLIVVMSITAILRLMIHTGDRSLGNVIILV